jgi:soluble lytic murein transglycosylase
MGCKNLRLSVVRFGNSKRVKAYLIGLVAGVSACSLQQPPTPVAVNPRGSVSAGSDGVRDAGSAGHPQMVALDLQKPVIARPELSDVRIAIERGEDKKALELFEATLNRVNPPLPERMRWHLWLAYAYQKRNDCARALPHFDGAWESPWPLYEYARFGAAQCRVALGALDDALRTVNTLKLEPPLADAASLFRAQVSSQIGQFNQAIEIWRAYLKHHREPGPERTSISLSLAQVLVAKLANVAESDFRTGDASIATTDDALREALSLLDSSNLRDLEADTRQRVFALKGAIVARLFSMDPVQQQQCRIRDKLDELEYFVESHDFKPAQDLASNLIAELDKAGLLSSAVGCRARFALAQSLAGLAESTSAQSQYEGIAKDCNEPEDTVARSLFALARRLHDQHELPGSIAAYEELGRRFPTHRLADDARLRLAYSYLELGSESKFTDTVLHLAQDYPQGDTASEGLFQLALRHMTRADWAGAASLLSQLGRLPRIVNRDDIEQTERQIYFSARAHFQAGKKELAFEGLEQLVRERPFSYYMLLAYSRLQQWDRDRAQRAKIAASTLNGAPPFSVPYQPQFETAGYQRAVELMTLGEIEKGTEEIRLLQLPKDLQPLLLWARAAFEATAGSLKNSQNLVRERLRDWPRRWPVGSWEPAWKVAFPQPFLDIVNRESKRSHVPQSLVYAVMREESQFDRDAASSANAYGLMQLILPTAKTAAKKLGITADAASLKQPAINVALGCEVLSKLMQKFERLPLMAIPAYNAGPGRPSRWLRERPDMDFDVWVEAIPIAETRTYIKHVLSSWATYAWLYERDQAEATMRLPLRIGD